ncbi:MAG: hypothetical protein ACKVLI_04925 [Alphaproteobacteria bacterium]|jgi:dihydrofolate reductase|tara:strand:+ start:45700 stop:46257 length:558 start_codon:yes stop_codon:yes gene_type:complete
MDNKSHLYTIGYVIISNDCFIANSTGVMPSGLKNDLDWQYFQSELNNSDLILIGRKSYVNFHKSKRNRLIPTSKIKDIEVEKSDLCFFNPRKILIEDAIKIFLPKVEKIAVVGGNKVYELVFNSIGFNEFHLTVANSFYMNEGILFNDNTKSLNDIYHLMDKNELKLSEKRNLDKNVTLYIFKKL